MEIVKFDTLGLDPKILRAITEMGFEEPSPIQAKASRKSCPGMT